MSHIYFKNGGTGENYNGGEPIPEHRRKRDELNRATKRAGMHSINSHVEATSHTQSDIKKRCLWYRS